MALEIIHKKNIKPDTTPIRLAIIQVVGTCVILAFVPGNITKLLSFLLFWGSTFGRPSKYELIIALLVNILFTFMNLNALMQGIFAFTHPDIASLLPVWELVMWSFYVIHTRRIFSGSGRSAANPDRRKAILCALVYSAPFGIVTDQHWLFIITLSLLLLSFVLFHERMDLAYTGYFVLLGAIIEYTGVYSGQWYYPSRPYTGVPLWFATMWGGVGLFTHRILC